MDSLESAQFFFTVKNEIWKNLFHTTLLIYLWRLCYYRGSYYNYVTPNYWDICHKNKKLEVVPFISNLKVTKKLILA